MNSKQKLYTRAEEEIKRRREINTNKLNERKLEIETAIPEYKEISREMSRTGEKLFTVILNGKDTKEKIEKLGLENLNVQNTVKALLIKNRYDPNYLDEIYTCNKCCDTGVEQNRRCSCFREIVKRLASEELNSSAPIKLSSFEMFDLSRYPDTKNRKIMETNFNICKEYAENFHLPCEGILMQGATGLGKTHISLAIAKIVIEKGYGVIYGTAQNLFHKIEKEHFGRDTENDTVQLLQNVDLLILDDLGSEFENRFYVSVLYNLLNSRLSAGLPTVVNTNFNSRYLKERYEDRIFSRLMTMEYLIFQGEDIRVNKKYGVNL